MGCHEHGRCVPARPEPVSLVSSRHASSITVSSRAMALAHTAARRTPSVENTTIWVPSDWAPFFCQNAVFDLRDESNFINNYRVAPIVESREAPNRTSTLLVLAIHASQIHVSVTNVRTTQQRKNVSWRENNKSPQCFTRPLAQSSALPGTDPVICASRPELTLLRYQNRSQSSALPVPEPNHLRYQSPNPIICAARPLPVQTSGS